jgi:hypothetical protein
MDLLAKPLDTNNLPMDNALQNTAVVDGLYPLRKPFLRRMNRVANGMKQPAQRRYPD